MKQSNNSSSVTKDTLDGCHNQSMNHCSVVADFGYARVVCM